MCVTAGAKEINPNINLLKKLTNAHATSGFENSVSNILKKEWGNKLSNLHNDGMGNLIGELKGQTKQPTVLIMTHMDEVGFLIREITDEGFVYVDAMGGWLDQAVFAQRWVIQTKNGPVYGYSGLDSKHSVPDKNKKNNIEQINFFIDIGAKSKQDAIERLGIRPGLPVTPDSEFKVLNNGERYLAKAFDDRATLSVLSDVLQELNNKNNLNIKIAATVQEEVGLRGAGTIYNSTKPDLVINLEAGIAKDFPMLLSEWKSREPALGKGPTVFTHDRLLIPNNKLVEFVVHTAKKHNIPFQYEAGFHYAEDAAILQKSGIGIPVINIGIPVRYAHTQAGIIDKSDYINLVKLLLALMNDIDADMVDKITDFT